MREARGLRVPSYRMAGSTSLRTLSTMCGRYAATANPDELVEEFEVEQDRTADPVRTVLKNPQNPPAGTPDWNLAPSKLAPVVLSRVPRAEASAEQAAGRTAGAAEGAAEGVPAEGVRQLRLLTWGLVPSWAKDVKVGMRMINARAESLFEKSAFRRAATARRCLVPADGWFEWQKSPTETDAKGKPRKQPFWMQPAEGGGLAFAGLYELWRDKERDAGTVSVRLRSGEDLGAQPLDALMARMTEEAASKR